MSNLGKRPSKVLKQDSSNLKKPVKLNKLSSKQNINKKNNKKDENGKFENFVFEEPVLEEKETKPVPVDDDFWNFYDKTT